MNGISCTQIFASAELRKLGESPSCSITDSNRKLVISLGKFSTLMKDEEVSFADNVIQPNDLAHYGYTDSFIVKFNDSVS